MDSLNTKIKNILTEKTLKVRPENIKNGVNILGITGNVVELDGETKTITPSTSQQIITPSSGKNAITQVTVEPIQTETKTVKSTTTTQTITPSSGKFINEITVNPMELETKTVTPSTSQQTILPTTGKDAISAINVSAVDSTIDNNIQAENIKKNVNILGVTGTLEEGITPTGTINITENGIVDVTNYASASVDVQGGGGAETQEEYDYQLSLVNDLIQDTVYPYTFLTYIQNSGTQYINTEYYPNQNTKIILKMETLGMIQGQTAFNAFGTSGSNSRFGWWTYYSGSSYFRYGIQSSSRDSKINVTGDFSRTLFTVTLDNSLAKIETPDNTFTYSVTPTDNFTLDVSLALGASFWNGGASIGNMGAIYKLYFCQIYENNELIRDFVPAKLDNDIGLYEKIERKFYKDSAGGNFIPGGEINE